MIRTGNGICTIQQTKTIVVEFPEVRRSAWHYDASIYLLGGVLR